MLVPYSLDVVLHAWGLGSPGPVDWEFRVESLGCLSSLVARLALEREVERWSLPAASVGLAVVEAESPLSLLGFINPMSDGVDLHATHVIFLRDAS